MSSFHKRVSVRKQRLKALGWLGLAVALVLSGPLGATDALLSSPWVFIGVRVVMAGLALAMASKATQMWFKAGRAGK